MHKNKRWILGPEWSISKVGTAAPNNLDNHEGLVASINNKKLPKVQEMFLRLEEFQFTISLVLNMGYYCTSTNILYETSKLCTIVQP